MALPLAATVGLTALKAAPGIVGLFKKNKTTPAERAMSANLAQATDLTNLSLNPNDPRYKTLLQNESQGIQQNFLSSLRDIIEANRRQKVLGRQQIFDPERQDESMFSAIVRGKQQADQQANTNVLERLNQAISNLRETAGTYGSLGSMQGKRFDANRQMDLAGLSAGGSFLGALSKNPKIQSFLGAQ